MKNDKLTGYTLLLDADCPMCNVYAKAFEQAGMIESTTAVPYQLANEDQIAGVAMEKARNEIALINTHTKEICYGVASLVHILSTRFPSIKKVMENNWVKKVVTHLYKFVSFNRKVIVPTATQKVVKRFCIPDFHLGYRMAYLVFVLLMSAYVLFNYLQPINESVGLVTTAYRELLICGGQFVWQSLMLGQLNLQKRMEYLGNMATVSLIGTFLLVPVLLLQAVLVISPFVSGGYFILVVGLMLSEHLRRCRLLEIGWFPTISWLGYRFVVLAILYAFA